MDTYKIRKVNGDWEQLVNPLGEVVAESHHLDAEDVLWGLGFRYECEEVWTEEDGECEVEEDED